MVTIKKAASEKAADKPIKKIVKKATSVKKEASKPATKKAVKSAKKAEKKPVAEKKVIAQKPVVQKDGKIAVIETGGKQYMLYVGSTLKVEKLEGVNGDKISFNKVLLIADGDDIQIGTPYLDDSTVEAKLIEQGRDKKVTIIKYKNKTRYTKKKGHRQPFTEVEIIKI